MWRGGATGWRGGPGRASSGACAAASDTYLTIDIVPGGGSGFSLEAPEGARFLFRSRLFTEDELAAANG